MTAGQFGALGADRRGADGDGGYDVAWKIRVPTSTRCGAPTATATIIANLIGAVSGNSTALESLETTFHQDLNGDGTIGLPTVVIEIVRLDQPGPGRQQLLSRQHQQRHRSRIEISAARPVTAGQFGAGAPIGAEQTASGYDVAWKMPGTDQYTVWSTDSNGNFISNITGVVSGNSTALESLETTFHQDLNGDGTIGVPPAPASHSAAPSIIMMA